MECIKEFWKKRAIHEKKKEKKKRKGSQVGIEKFQLT
jgi:hypothetical protein